MTTYILHGGQVKVDCDNNRTFWTEFTQRFDKSTVTICLIFWDRDPKEIPDLSKLIQQKIIDAGENKQINFIVPGDIDEIKANLVSIDVIYFSGGDFIYMKPFEKDVKELKNLIEGKVYIGSSIGSFLVSRYFISSFEDQDQNTQEGWGLLPITNLCHWDKETHKVEKISRLKHIAPDVPVLTLNETQYIEIIV